MEIKIKTEENINKETSCIVKVSYQKPSWMSQEHWESLCKTFGLNK